MTSIDYRVPLGVECAWPLRLGASEPRPSAWGNFLAALRRAFR